MALPPGTSLTEMPDAIDDPALQLEGHGFQGLVAVTHMGGALPHAPPGMTAHIRDVRVDGKPGQLGIYNWNERPRSEERRALLWTFEGQNDGTGKSLVIDATCFAQGCQLFVKIVDSLEEGTQQSSEERVL